VWVQNWGWYDPVHADTTYASAVARAKAYIDSHVSRTLTLDKPIVFEEFGLARDLGSFSPASPVTVRDRYYAEIFGHLYTHAKNNAVAGSNFWAEIDLVYWWRPRMRFAVSPAAGGAGEAKESAGAVIGTQEVTVDESTQTLLQFLLDHNGGHALLK
jgi:hypothetical protein